MTLLWMVGLLIFSGLISASETAVFSLQAGERRRLAARHPAAARLLLEAYVGRVRQRHERRLRGWCEVYRALVVLWQDALDSLGGA